jgi:hypothetical protein
MRYRARTRQKAEIQGATVVDGVAKAKHRAFYIISQLHRQVYTKNWMCQRNA